MNKNLSMSILLDLYGELLTEKQRDVLELYYNDDLSLAEIAQQYEISRQGVHDSIRRGEEALLKFEEILGLSRQEEQNKKQLEEFKRMALDIFEECKKVSFARNIADKTIVLLEDLDSRLAEYDNSKYLED
ncbi:putative DNA-binding protein [Ruminococcus sp. Marseille-P6503]|uniref:putative DNA-binding protein n=1 Tax=Ruminococcus sp. Marseille-P6503 TaxID=2364796 RepID=UPI001FA9DCAB|nr:putative DNA-binding protein [Ruminococcus sp. Marseille-P6503]